MDDFSAFLILIGIVVVIVRFAQVAKRLQTVERQLEMQSQKLQDLSHKFIELQNLPSPSRPTESPDGEANLEPIQKSQSILEPDLRPQIAEPLLNPLSSQVGQEQSSEPRLPPNQSSSRNQSPSFFSFEVFRNNAELESLIGGNILNRIGALALIFGIGFFLKYAFDNDLIPPVLRVLIGAGIGLALIGTGIRANAKTFEIFAQGLFGAGVAALYLSVYASFNFYQLVPQGVAFVLMSFVTALAFLLAMRYESLAISLLGWAGGFLTPFLLASNAPNVVGLFVYLALLNLGMLSIVFIKPQWFILESLSLWGTYLIYAIWYYGDSSEKPIDISSVFLTVVWLLFLASETYRAFQNERTFLGRRVLLSAVNAVFYFGFLYVAVMPSSLFFIAPIATAAIYLALYFFIRGRNRETISELLSIYLIGAIAFLAATVEVAFGDFITVTLWSLLSLLVMWVSRKMENRFLERASLILFSATLIRLFVSPNALSYQNIESFTPVLNLRVLAFFSFAISLAVSAVWLREEKKSPLSFAMDYAWSFLAFILLTVEVNDFFLKRELALNESFDFSRSNRSMSFGIVWLFYSTLLVWFGIRQSRKSLIRVGLAALFFGILWNISFGFFYEPIEFFIPAINLRVLSFLLVIVGVWFQLKWLRESGAGEGRLFSVLQYAFTALLFLLITTEALDYFRKSRLTSLQSDTGGDFYRALTLAALWTFYAVPMIFFGLKKDTKPLFTAGVFSFILAFLLAVGSGFEYSPIERFTLILNYRFAVYALLMLGSAFLAIVFRQSASPRFAGGFGIAAALLGTILLTAECADYFNQQIARLSFGENADDTAFDLSAQFENQKQLSISASLMLYSIGLMLYGIWRSVKAIRLTSIGLFALVILKIFIYDLSSLSTLYRIFSFIGLGVLLLLVSYLYQRFKHLILDENQKSTAA